MKLLDHSFKAIIVRRRQKLEILDAYWTILVERCRKLSTEGKLD